MFIRQVCKLSLYIHDILKGRVDGGTGRGKSKLLRGPPLPTTPEVTGNKPPDQQPAANAVLTSLTDISVDDDPETIKEANGPVRLA